MLRFSTLCCGASTDCRLALYSILSKDKNSLGECGTITRGRYRNKWKNPPSSLWTIKQGRGSSKAVLRQALKVNYKAFFCTSWSCISIAGHGGKCCKQHGNLVESLGAAHEQALLLHKAHGLSRATVKLMRTCSWRIATCGSILNHNSANISHSARRVTWTLAKTVCSYRLRPALDTSAKSRKRAKSLIKAQAILLKLAN